MSEEEDFSNISWYFCSPSESAYEAARLVVEATKSDAQKKTFKDFDLNSSAFDELIMSMDDSTDVGKIASRLCRILVQLQTRIVILN